MKRFILILAAVLLTIAAPIHAQVFGGGTITATVTTSGTPVKLSATNLIVKSFSVQLTSGSATFCVGGANVAAASGTGSCLNTTTTNIYYAPMGPNASYDLSRYYVDASVNSTVVTINYNVQQ